MPRPTGNGGFKSFSDLLRENGGDDEERNTFAGGETSGLEIQDPKKERERLMRQMREQPSSSGSDESTNSTNALLRQLMEKAQQNGAAPPSEYSDDDEDTDGEHFQGRGQRLGNTLETRTAAEETNQGSIMRGGTRPGKVSREITFWADGFTLGHDPTGKLYRYDDKNNEHYLRELDQGRAPLSLLDVQLGQRVDVTIKKNTDQKYVKPKKVGGFEGTGHRLGSDIDAESLNTVEAKTDVLKEENPLNEDELARKQPVEEGETKLQIRYANGTKEVYKVSLGTKIKDLYSYVKNGGKFNTPVDREFTINNVFPLKPLVNMDATLEEEGLKNSAVVQRWVI